MAGIAIKTRYEDNYMKKDIIQLKKTKELLASYQKIFQQLYRPLKVVVKIHREMKTPFYYITVELKGKKQRVGLSFLYMTTYDKTSHIKLFDMYMHSVREAIDDRLKRMAIELL